MSKVITLDKGSKRRLGQIRWKLVEISAWRYSRFSGSQ